MGEEHKIAGFWGADRLFRWTADAVAPLDLSDASKGLLIDVGLPIRVAQFEFEWSATPVRLQAAGWRLGYATERLEETWLRGELVISAARPNDPERHWNASVRQFAECLTEYQRLVEQHQFRDDTLAKYAVDTFAQTVERIDATALADPETVWSVTIEEMRYETDAPANDWG